MRPSSLARLVYLNPFGLFPLGAYLPEHIYRTRIFVPIQCVLNVMHNAPHCQSTLSSEPVQSGNTTAEVSDRPMMIRTTPPHILKFKNFLVCFAVWRFESNHTLNWKVYSVAARSGWNHATRALVSRWLGDGAEPAYLHLEQWYKSKEDWQQGLCTQNSKTKFQCQFSIQN